MATNWQIGDYVGLLDGTEKGHIIKLTTTKACIETREGFEILVPLRQLVKYTKTPRKKTDTVPVPVLPIPEKKVPKKTDPEFEERKKIRKVKDPHFKIHPQQLGEEKKPRSVKHTENIWEVDLHIEEIIDDYKHLSNGEIVDIQMRHAKQMIERARKNKVLKLVFIHGKGKGTLRSELLHLLSGFTNLEWYDASFKTYGGGATEVRLYLSKH